MKRFNVWILENSQWVPFTGLEELADKDLSRSALSEIMAGGYKRGTYKIRLKPE